MESLYDKLTGSTVSAIKSNANVLDINGKIRQEEIEGQQKQERINRILDIVSQTTELSKGVVDKVSSSDELIKFARKEKLIGNDTDFNFFDKIFGNLEFESLTGEVFNRQSLTKRQLLSDINK